MANHHQRFRPLEITWDQSSLRQSVGFWSGMPVWLNPTDSIVLIDRTVTIETLRRIWRENYEANLEVAIRGRIDHHLARLRLDFQTALSNAGNRFGPAFEAANIPAFQADEFKTPNKKVSWAKISAFLQQKFPGDEEQQKRFLVQKMAELARCGGNPVRLNIMGSHWLQLGNRSLRQLFSAADTAESLIGALATLREYSVPIAKRQDLDILASHNAPVLQVCVMYGLHPSEIRMLEHSGQLEALSCAASTVLALFAAKRAMLFPPSWVGMTSAASVVYEKWPWEEIRVTKNRTRVLARLLLASTVDGIEDLPEDIHRLAKGFPDKASYNTLFRPLIDRHAESSPGLAPWPVARLNLSKERRPTEELAWTPHWIREQGYPPAWVRLAEIAWESSDAGSAQKKRAVRDLLPWVRSRQFASPSEVRLTDLRDPHNPNRTDTWRAYLVRARKQDDRVDVGQSWAATATAWTRVVNQLKMVPDPLLADLDNPFAVIGNPFNYDHGSASKRNTSRRRLPAVLHEAMLDVLCDFDATGAPTYQWVRETLPWDWFKRKNPISGQEEDLWCPSRAACLALLLVLCRRSHVNAHDVRPCE